MFTIEEMNEKLNKIHCMDCLNFMEQVPDKYFDLVLTDIPYGECNVDNNGIWDKNTNMEDMHKADTFNIDMQKLLKEFDRICKGSYYIFCGTEQSSEIISYFKKNKHSTRLVIWEKTNPMPINGQYVFLSGIETCVWAKKSGAIFNANCKNTVFRHPIPNDNIKHPTSKPVELFQEFIRISTNKGDKVFDPCMGSGTTAIAAESLGLDWCGCELDEEYCKIARDRLSKVQGSLF